MTRERRVASASPVVLLRASRGMGRYAPLARRAARAALLQLGAAPCELSVALVGDDEMRELNRSFRGKDRPTDVLAFAQQEGEEMPAGTPIPLLGDVVVSLPTAERQAAARGIPLEREIATLLVHGILHLLGYDHERSPSEARRMFRRQREVVAAVLPPTRDEPTARRRRRRIAPTAGASTASAPASSRRRALADRAPAR